MTEWREMALGDVVMLQRGFDLPKEQREHGDVPVIAATGQVGSHSSAMVAGPGVVLGRSGSVGGGQYIEPEFWPLNTTLWVKDFRLNYPRFIYYLFKTIDFDHLNAGAAVPTLNRNHVYQVPVLRPPLPEQRAIAGVLGALDDRIAANRRMAAVLEGMARAIFTDWFVDFGPTRAKMAGAPPWLAPEIWDMFPDSLDPATGLPNGWEMKPLDEVANFLNGLALQKYSAARDAPFLPVIKIAELRNGVSDKSDRASIDVPDAYVITNGDFLFSWSGSLLAKFWYGGKGALNQHLFKVTSSDYPNWYIANWVQRHLDGFRTIAASKAVTMGHIKREHLHEAKVLVPSSRLLSQMNQIMSPMLDRQHQIEIESRSLAQMRDLLLTPLMSGRLRVATAPHPPEDNDGHKPDQIS